MRKYDRRYVNRMTRSDAARSLLPNPLTRVELPPAPPQTRVSGVTGPLNTSHPPGAGSTPAR
ncbi:hypothetical protein GobsT_04320 [Gemmata obscuriglobus]|uniref:Uncharacterized protein n=1 Tax=Gemmata obscuriglobus TaxID=114 RepID=A0A2Z3HBQ7_9BACT|nr:hypothetical protein [Gemmata obscuriglobus]AWM40977.1 hypothetical protein C1280_31010 [Gemmata obscuriglobus]QEG25705.1 hypothetical protein GobsT_04320 [Gemmata obscuriglobus]VTR99393.1 unnamed protein product [Gemmata obscuriglobus UQM 2246]